MEREAALASNGGVGSPGLETEEDEEKTRVKAEEEEAQRRAKEQASLDREAEEKKVKSKAVKAAPLPPPAPLLVEQESDEPPWYFDCEICKDAGWNLVSFAARPVRPKLISLSAGRRTSDYRLRSL